MRSLLLNPAHWAQDQSYLTGFKCRVLGCEREGCDLRLKLEFTHRKAV